MDELAQYNVSFKSSLSPILGYTEKFLTCRPIFSFLLKDFSFFKKLFSRIFFSEAKSFHTDSKLNSG